MTLNMYEHFISLTLWGLGGSAWLYEHRSTTKATPVCHVAEVWEVVASLTYGVATATDDVYR